VTHSGERVKKKMGTDGAIGTGKIQERRKHTQSLLHSNGVGDSSAGGLGGVGEAKDLAINSLEVLDVHCSVAHAACKGRITSVISQEVNPLTH
jgi:hypothetical protein